MPNPRDNTVLVADDMARGVREAKAGRADFRIDRNNVFHVIRARPPPPRSS